MPDNTNLMRRFIYQLGGLLVLLMNISSCNDNQEKEAATSNDRPNIIILLADDLGYGDLSCYGSQSIETPHLDSLAASGMRFTNFYSGSAVCSPARVSLLTGKFPLRFDVRQHFTDSIDHLPEQAVTMAELLQEHGYNTCHIGKWHLGGLRLSDIERRNARQFALPGPLQQGFDHYLTNIEGRPIRPRLISERKLYREGGKTMLRNDQQAPPSDDHWTEIKINEAINWLTSRDHDQPFFLNLWFDVPHTPYEPAPEPHLSKYKAMGVEGDQLYFRSMVSHLDAQIGRLIRWLKQEGLYDNTLIIFTSDNGPAYQGSPGPFKGGKTDLHEGGIRVPMFAVWNNRIPANQHSFQTAHMVDLLPTFAGLAGFDPPDDLDGIDILPVLTGRQESLNRPALLWQMDLYRHFQNQGPKPEPYATGVVIDGKWKLLADSLRPTEVFNLRQDHREIYNLLDDHNTVRDTLLQKLEEFYQAPRLRWEDEGLKPY